jgi:hypothetical protein
MRRSSCANSVSFGVAMSMSDQQVALELGVHRARVEDAHELVFLGHAQRGDDRVEVVLELHQQHLGADELGLGVAHERGVEELVRAERHGDLVLAARIDHDARRPRSGRSCRISQRHARPSATAKRCATSPSGSCPMAPDEHGRPRPGDGRPRPG